MEQTKNTSLLKTSPGTPLPLGTTLSERGVQFSVFSRHATALVLQLFNSASGNDLAGEIILDPEHNKTGDIWHVFVEGIKAGQLYGYRAEGPYRPQKGLRFNKNKLLLDPLHPCGHR